MNFSVIMSVYKNDKLEFVGVALDSMLVKQNVKPTEIVLVEDGPVSDELNALLDSYAIKYPDIFNIIKLTENKGLGNALKLGVENAKYEYVARMDSDDICVPERFGKQLYYMSTHSDVDIVGGQMTEFIDYPENIVSTREVPLDNEAIYKYMKSRCALNHVTVMFKKESIVNAGNYQDWFWNEDYFLWIRLMMSKCKFANLPDVLVNVRSGTDQYARRGGRKYYESEKNIKKLMLEHDMISRISYAVSMTERFILQIMLPSSIRGWVFRTFARR